MVHTLSLSPGITLRCVSLQRFKQGLISFQLVRPMRTEENACNALLPAVLLRGTQQYPDLRAITMHLDDLYGGETDTVVRRVGDYQTTGLCCSFLEDAYTFGGEGVLAKMLTFLESLIYSPRMENGCFCRDYVESEKQNLIDAILAQRNDKRLYAANQLMRNLCSADPFGLPRLGEPEQVAAITPEALWAHYRKILSESRIDLFYVGSAKPEQVASLLRPVFADKMRRYVPLPPQTPFADGGKKTVTEHMDVAQEKLCLGFVTPITLQSPEFAAMQVLNAVLGGSMNSKLFMQVRERQSLCYDISSGYYGSKGILTISAGIDSAMEEKTRKEIQNQLQACQAGDISEAELSGAKKALQSSLQGLHDSPFSIENYYATGALSGLTLSPEDYRQAVERVTVPQITDAAKTLTPHTVYCLKGEST